MAKISVLDYDIATAANNSDIGSIAILGTSPISNFDNAFRELMLEIGVAITRHVTKAAGTYTPAKTDHNQLWRATGAVTLNLTAAATLTTGWALWLKADGGAILVDPNSTETINGATTLTIPDGSSAFVVCTGTAFFANVVGNSSGPSSATDKAIARFNGTTGNLVQNSGVIIDDTNNVTGVVQLTATGALKAAQDFTSTTTAAALNTTGAGNVFLRPNGAGSATGQLQVASTGAATVNGTLTVTDQIIASVSASEIFRNTSTALHIGKTAGNLTAAGTTFFATGTSDGLFQCTRDHNIVGQFNVINPVGTETILEFHTSGTAKGSVTINGSTTAYNTTSDRRLKENPRPFDAGAIIDKLKVYQFDWKAGGSGYGVFAQEAIKAFPDAVAKGKGKKYWQVDYSKYVPLLIRECQSLREEIKALKASR
jgi:hypothetical protein